MKQYVIIEIEAGEWSEESIQNFVEHRRFWVFNGPPDPDKVLTIKILYPIEDKGGVEKNDNNESDTEKRISSEGDLA